MFQLSVYDPALMEFWSVNHKYHIGLGSVNHKYPTRKPAICRIPFQRLLLLIWINFDLSMDK